MSVAFRRDSDEEHLEPKFERPIPQGPNLVTERALRAIAERVAALLGELGVTTGEAARTTLSRDLRYWQARQTSARLAPVAAGDKVEFGIRVSFLLHGEAKVFSIVGDDEADPASGAISFNAPLSRAMLGAEVGDVLPFGEDEEAIEILAIEALPD